MPLPLPPAGKSTLLDVLAGRKTGGISSGEVHINGCAAGGWVLGEVVGWWHVHTA